jgi:hypothetical protein
MLRYRRHPDKNSNSDEATEKFKEVNAAYARLTSAEESDDDLDDIDPESFFMDELFEELGIDPLFILLSGLFSDSRRFRGGRGPMGFGMGGMGGMGGMPFMMRMPMGFDMGGPPPRGVPKGFRQAKGGGPVYQGPYGGRGGPPRGGYGGGYYDEEDEDSDEWETDGDDDDIDMR